MRHRRRNSLYNINSRAILLARDGGFPRKLYKIIKFSRSAHIVTNMGSRKRLFESARIAEQAELYEDMVKAMKELVMAACGAKDLLAKDERNLLSVAYKNVVGTRRSAWRAINTFEQKQEGSFMEQAKVYKGKIAEEVREYCNDVIVSECNVAKLISIVVYLNRTLLASCLKFSNSPQKTVIPRMSIMYFT